MTGSPGPDRDQQARKLQIGFVSVWLVVGAVILGGLTLIPPSATPLGPSSPSSYLDSAIPTGTNFSFEFSIAIPIYRANLTGPYGSPTVPVLISGNWTSTAPTWTGARVGESGATPCLLVVFCEGQGNQSGPLHLTIEAPTQQSSEPGIAFVVLYLEFWAEGNDVVTVTSPIGAAEVSVLPG
ncbi:MAG: hypothetical protein ACLPZM_03890 [Thermoplasmata archaeon]